MTRSEKTKDRVCVRWYPQSRARARDKRTRSEVDVKDGHALSLPSSVVLLLLDPVRGGPPPISNLPPSLVHVERVLADQVRPGHMQEGVLCKEEHLARDAVVEHLAERKEEEHHVGGEQEHQKQVESKMERQWRPRRG